MAAPKEIVALVERFESNKESYKSGHYNETQVRREFVDPFFKVLGWDIDNEQGFAEAYTDVIHEEAVKVGTTTKAPDYSSVLVPRLQKIYNLVSKKITDKPRLACPDPLYNH